MTFFKCDRFTCGGTWTENEVIYKRKLWDPYEGWRYEPVCPACMGPVSKVTLCPICFEEIDRGAFCDGCVDKAVWSVKNFLNELTIQDCQLKDLSEDLQEEFLQRVFEEI